MMRKLRPTQLAESVLDIDFSQLHALGKRAVILDLDNTLCRRGEKQLGAEVSRYINEVLRAGFRVGILTNRRRNETDPIVKDLREWLPVISSAGKPRRAGYVKMMQLLDSEPQTTVMIGDKSFTDIWGANRLGIDSIRVRTYPRFPENAPHEDALREGGS